jgi:hypothetical protein
MVNVNYRQQRYPRPTSPRQVHGCAALYVPDLEDADRVGDPQPVRQPQHRLRLHEGKLCAHRGY